MTSTPRLRAWAMGSTAVEPQSTASSSVVGNFFRQFSTPLSAQAVAFFHPVGQIKFHAPAQRAQYLHQQGGGSDAVHVVIAKNHERFILLAGAKKTFHGLLHVRQQKRVGEVFEARCEEVFDGGNFTEAAVEQALGEQRGNVQRRCQPSGEQRLGGASDQEYFIWPSLSRAARR